MKETTREENEKLRREQSERQGAARQSVALDADELAAFREFQARRREEDEARRRKEDREAYAQMVDEEVSMAVPELMSLSEQIRATKRVVYENFRQVLRMKSEVMGLAVSGQRTHTFTTSRSDYRLTLGVNTVDAYRDTVEDGIQMVRQYIESLATDEKSKTLVSAIMRLLSRDAAGNLKASRVLQLRRMAEEADDAMFLEGVRIIEESYQPTATGQFIRAEYKDDRGRWHSVPLSVTDCNLDDDEEEKPGRKDADGEGGER